MATLFYKDIVRLHGIPRSLLSDRDPVFLSAFWTELFRLSHTKLRMSSAYHPQTDGQTEVVNRCLEAYLRCFSMEQPHKWSQFLPWAEFSFNTGFHTSAGTTPFKLVYGLDPPAVQPSVRGETRLPELEEQLTTRDRMLQVLKGHLLKAQHRMKQQADSQRREQTSKEADLVLLHLQPYRQRSLARRGNQKLSPRFFGPYKVLRRIGSVAYELELPSNSKIHPVFHVSLLKLVHGQVASICSIPPPISDSFELLVHPEKVMAHRWTQHGTSKILELLILWKNRPSEEASWEEYDLLQQQFPNFRLEDKSTFKGGCNNSTPAKMGPWKTYVRRKNKSN